MTEYIPSSRKWVAEQVEIYESSGGLEGTTYKVEGDPLRDTGLPVIIVTHTGLKTGAIRKTPLIRVSDGNNYILIDTSADLKQQFIINKIKKLSSVLLNIFSDL